MAEIASDNQGPGAHGRLAEEQDFSGTPEPPNVTTAMNAFS